jgi:tetratricopeptide (TPR) repeat protein
MKKPIVFILVFFIAYRIVAQNGPQDLFQIKYAAMLSQFNPDGSGQKISQDNITLFKEQYKRLETGLEEIEQYQFGVLETGRIFDSKELKLIDKNGNISELEKTLNTYSTKMKIYLGQNSEFGIDQNECLMSYSNLKQSLERQDYNEALIFWREMFISFPGYQNAYSKGDVLIRTKIKQVEQEASDLNKKFKEANDLNKRDEAKTHAEKQKKLLAEKELWIDTLLMIYDQRIRYFGTDKNYGQGWSLGKKGLYLMEYRKDIAYEEAYILLKQSLDIEKEKSSYDVINSFFDASMMMLRSKKITIEDLITTYTLCLDLLKLSTERYYTLIDNEKTKIPMNETGIKNWESYITNNATITDRITKYFATAEETKCEALISTFKDRFEMHQTDNAWLKNVTGILSFKECTNDPFYGQAAEALYKLDPSSNAASKLALYYLKKENYTEAGKYFKEAYTLEADKTVKAEYYYYAAVVEFAQNKYVNARILALKAVELKSNYGKPYLLIAKLYAASASTCGTTEFEKKAVYWGAVDKLIKARTIDLSVTDEANDLITKYSARFPNSEEGFMSGIYEGSSYKIECWIQETTSVRY